MHFDVCLSRELPLLCVVMYIGADQAQNASHLSHGFVNKLDPYAAFAFGRSL